MNRIASRTVSGPGPLLLPLHLVVVASVVLAAAFVLSSRVYESPSSHDALSVGCGLAVIALMAYTRYFLGLPWLSASIVYLALFWMFHFGLTFTAVLAPDVVAPFEDWETAWMYWPNVRLAMVLGVLGAAGFVAGLVLTALQRTPPQAATGLPVHDPVMYGVGWVIMLGGLGGATFTLLAGGGLGVLALSYMEFRTGLLSLSAFQTYLDLSQLGCVLALCGAGGRRWIKPLAAWSPIGCLMLLVGLRGQTLFPAAAFAIVLAHRGVRFHRGTLVAAVIAAMVVIPIVRTVRNVGVANESEVDWRDTSPLETFTELGSTLRAVKAYVDWIEEGDEYQLGATYWVPFDRQLLTRLVPGREVIPFEEDERLPERLIQLEGAVGLSATGEAYYNFGPPGPFIYFALVGLLFGWLERRAWKTPYHSAALGIVMGIFYINIRGHWINVPAQTALSLVPVAFCYMVSRAIHAPRARDAVQA